MTGSREAETIHGRFTVERLVARGGMGCIYRALDSVEQTVVALKVLDNAYDAGEDVDRFTREASLLARIRHPRIVRYVSHGRMPSRSPFLAMQWLEGEDLGARLARGPLSLSQAKSVLQGAAEALAAVHEIGVVHRDLKPSNLFLRGGSCDDVVLIDFGIARRLEPTRRITATGVLLGTALYMAPEQAADKHAVQPSTDVFSLGAIFYECLTGATPFAAPHFAGVLARILFDAETPVRALHPAVPEAWAALVSRMLDKDPKKRPKDGAALLAEITRLPAATDDPATTLQLPSSGVTRSARSGGEQTRICVILARPPTAAAEARAKEDLSAARAALAELGLDVEGLADGSLLATITSRGAATDQARLAATSALRLREVWPDARIAIATGRAVLASDTRVGEAVDRAARLLDRTGEAAEAFEGIRIDAVTAGLLGGRFSTVEHASGIVLCGERADGETGRLLLGKPTPCVGREFELRQLEALLARAVEEPSAQAAVLLAPAGTGKSRLRIELLRRIRDAYPGALVLVGEGDPLTAGSPYVHLGDALRRFAQVRAGDASAEARGAFVERVCRYVAPDQKRRVGEFLGELCRVPFPAEESPPLSAARSDPRVMSDQISLAFLDWISAECEHQPLVLVLEDLQWGDSLTVKLVQAALRDRPDAPLFALALARPEVKDVFPSLFGERAQEITLRPLGRKASVDLVRRFLGDASGEETIARIVDLAGGHPLFLEELIRAAAEGKARDVPETVLAILQSRIARLAPDTRRALRAGSIFGEAFWAGPVERMCELWGAGAEVAVCLSELVDAEIIERRRQSRLPGEIEYGFRHALVRDAAYGLLTDEDLRSGHHFAGEWLEAVGEADAMALAGHALAAGDGERAIVFFTKAAEQSLSGNDFAEALARAKKGLACGVEGPRRGALLYVVGAALYGQASLIESAQVGAEALALLPRGGVDWCTTVEHLLHTLPQIGEIEGHRALSDELFQTEPLPEARSAYVCAILSQVLGLAIVLAREAAERCFAFADKVESAVFERDLSARGIRSLWRGLFVYYLEPDPYLAVCLIERAERDLAEAQIMYRLAYACAVESGVRTAIGDHERAEGAARRGVAIAAQIQDDYHRWVCSYYVVLSLCERPSSDRLDEAKRLVEGMLAAKLSATNDGLGRFLLSKIHLARGEWASAEAEARLARVYAADLPHYGLVSVVCLVQSLLGQGRAAEAAELARQELLPAAGRGSMGWVDVPLLVTAAEALFAAGDRGAAESVLREALAQIEARAAKIPDAALKEAFLQEREENLRARRLEREWFSLA